MLRLAVDPTSGAEARDLLGDVLFTEDHHIRAWHTLRDADGDLHTALAAADPDVADLLGRLAVEDTVDTPRDIRRALLRDAHRAHAGRPAPGGDRGGTTRPVDLGQEAQATLTERPLGVFSRQMLLGDALDTDRINTTYHNGVLALRCDREKASRARSR